MTKVHFLLGTGLAATCLIYYQYRQNQTKEKVPKEELINEVLFFPDKEFPCTTLIQQLSVTPSTHRKPCRNPSCRKLHNKAGEPRSSLLKFLNYLSEAKSSVDICIFVFTQPIIAKLLVSLASTGVQVRVITDACEDEAAASQINSIREHGIVVKSNKKETGALMHHKFVLVDGKVLLTGSFNWTNKAVVSNYEAVLVTSQESLVAPFKWEFESMWTNFNLHPKTTRHF